MKDLKDEKMAEEILHDNLNEHLSIFVNTYPVAYQSEQMLKDWIVNAMKDYHQAKLAEVTDEDIETWAENFVKNPEHYFHSVKDLIIGAKAFQKGEIKHIDNQ